MRFSCRPLIYWASSQNSLWRSVNFRPNPFLGCPWNATLFRAVVKRCRAPNWLSGPPPSSRADLLILFVFSPGRAVLGDVVPVYCVCASQRRAAVAIAAGRGCDRRCALRYPRPHRAGSHSSPPAGWPRKASSVNPHDPFDHWPASRWRQPGIRRLVVATGRSCDYR